ncbi:uncharacterized protein LOC105698439 [Orussus abietinus]|uniref:uncharacterized protein LOC105698439 n=1 Tax=Orussus abietinus TaxID=222816 RepID=UPI0006268F26|nr:uncharacterized protein LOC105698439 [Orussus abietinus]
MEKIRSKIASWTELLVQEKLNEVAADIMKTVTAKPDAQLNRALFRLLLHLAHVADKCIKKNLEIGKDIWFLSIRICSTLVDIPDTSKFLASIYHISRCLMEMGLYKEAIEVCDYMFPGKLVRVTSNIERTIYSKTAMVWHMKADQMTQQLTETVDKQTIEKLLIIIKYELQILRHANEHYSKPVLSNSQYYVDRVKVLCQNTKPTIYNMFCNGIIDCLQQLNISVEIDDEIIVYRYVISFINKISEGKTTITDTKAAHDTLKRACAAFENCFATNIKCHRHFQVYKRICLELVKPVDFLDKNLAKVIKNIVTEMEMNLEKFDKKQHVPMWTAYKIAELLQSLFNYWENSVKNGIESIITTQDVLYAIVRLILCISSIIDCQTGLCRTCPVGKCKAKRDVFNGSAIRTRCLGFISIVLSKSLSQMNASTARELIEENIRAVIELKDVGCLEWIPLWIPSGTVLYNLGFIYERICYEESVSLYSLLCTCIVHLEGIGTSSTHLKLSASYGSSMSCALHHLTSVHFNNKKYREAMTTCALNGLLTYTEENSKAFRMWASIKHKNKDPDKNSALSMLGYLRMNSESLKEIGVQINLEQYDLPQLCLREIKGLQGFRSNLMPALIVAVNELEQCKVNPMQYGLGVLLLGYHSFGWPNVCSISMYFRKAVSKLKEEQAVTSTHLLLQVSFQFFDFLDELQKIRVQTQTEMESAKYALYARQLSEDLSDALVDSVVPAYTRINVKENAWLKSDLTNILLRWGKYVKNVSNRINQQWESEIAFGLVAVIAEYCRLHRFEEEEVQALKIAFSLADALPNRCALLSVVSRAIMSRHIDAKWIAAAQETVESLKDTDNEQDSLAVAEFFFNLADFNFEIGKCEEATKLFNNAIDRTGFELVNNSPTYLLGIDVILRNYTLHSEGIDQRKCLAYMVRSLYSMIGLANYPIPVTWSFSADQLYSYDILLSATCNLALRMNALLTFREISMHLVVRLNSAQKLGATLRVAECLKMLCFLDISRARVEDCEVKLQGLEHILGTEDVSPSTNSTTSLEFMSEKFLVDLTRNARIEQNDASPVLRRKPYIPPAFLEHVNCDCYKCTNIAYQHLVFSSTHIRAQLYALQQQSKLATLFFLGAYQLRMRLLKKESTLQHVRNLHYKMVEYVQFLLDYARFLIIDSPEELEGPFSFITEAFNVCLNYRLQSHPIYFTVKEFALEMRFLSQYDERNDAKFTVSHVDEAGSNYESESEKNKSTALCVTPTTAKRNIKPKSIRRIKSPPILKLTAPGAPDSEDEDEMFKPKLERPIRRRIIEDEYEESPAKIKTEEKPSSRVTLPPAVKSKALDVTPTTSSSSTVKPGTSKSSTGRKTSPEAPTDESGSLQGLTKSLKVLSLEGPAGDTQSKRQTRARKNNAPRSTAFTVACDSPVKKDDANKTYCIYPKRSTRLKNEHLTPSGDMEKLNTPGVPFKEEHTEETNSSSITKINPIPATVSAGISSDKESISVPDGLTIKRITRRASSRIKSGSSSGIDSEQTSSEKSAESNSQSAKKDGTNDRMLRRKKRA